MTRKPRPDSNLAGITPEQADRLFELLRTAPYHAAARRVAEEWGIAVSISGLKRWRDREARARARADLRSAVKASEQFDKDLDARALDERAAHALRAAFWQAITSGDIASVQRLGSLVLDYNADARDTEKLQRLLKAEKDLKEAREENAALAAQAAALRRQLAEAGKAGAADPAAVADELDRHLGVKK